MGVIMGNRMMANRVKVEVIIVFVRNTCVDYVVERKYCVYYNNNQLIVTRCL